MNKLLSSILVLLIMTMPITLHAAPAKGVGMWVWSEASFATEKARQKLVRYCVRHDISHLDIHIRFNRHDGIVSLKDPENLKELILRAGEHTITTAALRGNPRMFFADRQEQTLRELMAIIAFSKTLPGDNLFKGIKYDVEPYLVEEWKVKGESRKRVMLDYLTYLHRAKARLGEERSPLWLAVDMPFWWDKDTLALEFQGETKRFSEHVQDATDFTVLMSYRRKTGQVLSTVENERKYARKIHKVVFPALETGHLTKDGFISFWGLPAQELWTVVPQLLETAKTDQAMGGVMLHCYRSLAEGEGMPLQGQNSDAPVAERQE